MSEESGSDRTLCAGCGCLCEDVELRMQVDTLVPHTDCEPGADWFRARIRAVESARSGPDAWIEGREASLEEALDRAAELLSAARHPVLFGLDDLEGDGARAAIELADRRRATVDGAATRGHLGSILAMQAAGGVSATLGEVRERADRLVLWFCRPDRSHPRYLERFYAGRTHDGRERRRIAVGPEAGSAGADVAVEVPAEGRLPLLWLLRLLLADGEAPEGRAHPLAPAARRVLEAVEDAGYGVWLYDADPPPGRSDAVHSRGLVQLLVALNGRGPWAAGPLRRGGNPVGAELALAGAAGYPVAVSYRSGVPRYLGGSFEGRRTLGSGAADLAIALGPARASLPEGRSVPVVWLDDGTAGEPEPGAPPAVRIRTVPAGTRAGDVLYRMDGLPVRSPGLPLLEPPDRPPAGALLRELLERSEEPGTLEAAG